MCQGHQHKTFLSNEKMEKKNHRYDRFAAGLVMSGKKTVKL